MEDPRRAERPPLTADDPGLGPRFAVRRLLGSGSFGVVYEAFDRERGEPVAVKILSNVDPDALFRFKREFRTLADLRHPNIIRLYELLSSGDRWYFTMELIEGERFLNWVRGIEWQPRVEVVPDTTVTLETPSSLAMPEHTPVLPPVVGQRPKAPGPHEQRLRDALRQLAAGVEALHRFGKLHRDLKSSNVLVRTDGRVAILDFGVAAELTAERGGDTYAGLVGTPSYMAPEQAMGGAVRASDWYAVGVMLYEALTGQLPFEGAAVEVLNVKRQHDPVDPRERANELPDDLCELCLQLLRRDPDDRPSGHAVLAGLTGGAEGDPDAEPSRPRPLEPSVLGRDRQRAAVEEAFRNNRRGQPVVVHLRGSSGMGKSALLRQCLRDLSGRHGAVVFDGRCFERESVPYKALDGVVDAIRQYLLRLPAVEAAQRLPRDVGPLARLFPVLGAVSAIAESPRLSPARDPHEQRHRAVQALRELLARTADRGPLVLAIDDLQWGDADSASVLAEVLRPPDAPAVLLLLCCRSEEADASPFLRVFDAATSRLECRSVEVGPLAAGEARALALDLLGAPSVDPVANSMAETVARESGGNPFFIEELVMHLKVGPLARAGSEITLGQMLAARFTRLPADARRLLEVIAVAGRPLAAAVAGSAAQLDGAEWRGALDVLGTARLVRTGGPGGDEVEAIHDRVRDAAVGMLGVEQLVRWHGRLGEALEASGGADPEWLAEHFRESGQPGKAAGYAKTAAERAASALAFERAARLYASAIEMRGEGGERAELRVLRIGHGEALAALGRGEEAADAFLGAAECAREDPELRLDCRRRAAEHLLGSGRVERGLAELTAVLAEVGQSLPATPRRALLSILRNRAWLRLRGLRFEPRDEQDVPVRERLAMDVLYIAGANLALVDAIRGAAFQVQGLLRALRAGELRRLGRALAIEAGYQASTGNRALKRAHELAAASDRIAREVADPVLFAYSAVATGLTCYFGGRFKEAVTHFLEAESRVAEAPHRLVWERHHIRTYRLASLHFMGSQRELDESFVRYVEDAERRGDLYAQATLRRWFNGVWLARDDVAGARADLERTPWPPPSKGFHLQHWLEARARASLELYAGLHEGVFERLEPSFEGLSRSMWIRTGNIRREALWLRGRVALASGELGIAGRMARRLAKERLPHAEVWSAMLRAGLAVRGGDEAAARGILERVAELAVARHLGGCAAAARMRLAAMAGGGAGGEEAFRADGVKDPARMVGLILPV